MYNSLKGVSTSLFARANVKSVAFGTPCSACPLITFCRRGVLQKGVQSLSVFAAGIVRGGMLVGFILPMNAPPSNQTRSETSMILRNIENSVCFSSNVNPGIINAWLINRVVSPFSGDASLLEGTPP